MIPLETVAEGIVLPVQAQPGARRNAVRVQEVCLKVSVTQAAEKGKANQAVVEALCDAFGLRKSQVELLSGGKSRQKRFLIREVSAEELRQRIERAAGT